MHEGSSRFYAEIQRLRQLNCALAANTQAGTPALLFLLDELLQGTNSTDRRIGAQGVVRAFLDGGSIGLISTHDLALTDIDAAGGYRLHNVHFQDELVDGRMTFDFKLREGDRDQKQWNRADALDRSGRLARTRQTSCTAGGYGLEAGGQERFAWDSRRVVYRNTRKGEGRAGQSSRSFGLSSPRPPAPSRAIRALAQENRRDEQQQRERLKSHPRPHERRAELFIVVAAARHREETKKHRDERTEQRKNDDDHQWIHRTNP